MSSPHLSLLCAATATAVVAACAGTSDPAGAESPDLSCTIPTDKIFAGAVRDGIPALTNPTFAGAADAGFLNDNARVLGLVVNGEARAYPLPILWWHEVVNDVLGGEPVLISYCPLTGSGIAFDPRVGGDLRNFGVSGVLYENNLIMFDRERESLWNQMLLGSQCGPDRGVELTRLPVVETTWRHWKTMYPNTTAMTPDTGFDFPYGFYPYGDYAALNNSFTLFPTSGFSDLRPPKELVLGVREVATARAYPFGALEEAGDVLAINETVGGRSILVTYIAAERTALAFERRVGDRLLTFQVADPRAMTFVDAETGTTWDAAGVAVSGPLAADGVRLTPLRDAFVVFWFAWSVFYPNTELFLQPPVL